MESSEVVVATTEADGKTIVECSKCGPVGVSSAPIAEAALAHLRPVHDITEMKQVP